ncbi:MAG: hypothetical protein UR12_C0032G0011 [candidate division TM6 bacterium GW2011_GWF2_30_66]|jgi:hypothetical protein|nr:MAG: hypothetical protein UR12_C0032G0011 [candidate division TM6 bacterium GW2011_GWF2_30_66]
MKKNINLLILTTFLFITSGKIFAAKGINIKNNSGQDILVKIDKMAPNEWVSIPPTGKSTKFIATTGTGSRGVYWTIDGINLYVTGKFTSPDIIEIEKDGIFTMTESSGGGLLGTSKKVHSQKKAGITNLKGVESYKADTESKKTSVEKIKGAIDLPEKVIKAAIDISKIINNLEIVSEELVKESEAIKNEASKIGSKKLISEKIRLLKNILEGQDGKQKGRNIRDFISMGIYPLMNQVSRLLSITANGIVDPITDLLSIAGKNMPGVFDKKTKNALIATSDTIQTLTKASGQQFKSYSGTIINKNKNNKSIGEYTDMVIKILTNIENSLKNTQWFRN